MLIQRCINVFFQVDIDEYTNPYYHYFMKFHLWNDKNEMKWMGCKAIFVHM